MATSCSAPWNRTSEDHCGCRMSPALAIGLRRGQRLPGAAASAACTGQHPGGLRPGAAASGPRHDRHAAMRASPASTRIRSLPHGLSGEPHVRDGCAPYPADVLRQLLPGHAGDYLSWWLAVMPSKTSSSAGSHFGQTSSPVSLLCPSMTTSFARPGSLIKMMGGGSRPSRAFSAICR